MSFAPGDIVREVGKYAHEGDLWRVIGHTSRGLVVVESMGGVRVATMPPDQLRKVDDQ